MTRKPRGHRFRLRSVLGEHSDRERPRLRRMVAARLPELTSSAGCDRYALAQRQQLAKRVVQKWRVEMRFHVSLSRAALSGVAPTKSRLLPGERCDAA